MVSGINSGLSNMGWYNMAQMNDLKLTMLSNQNSRVAEVSGISSKQKQELSDSDKKFLNDYQGAMADLWSAASNLDGMDGKSALNALGIQSSNGDVLTAKARYAINDAASYTVDVRQTAAAQMSRTAGLDASAAPTVQSGSFQLATTKGTYEFEFDPSEAKDNKELLSAIADEINGLKTGVTAQVVNDKGKVSLQLTGNETGEGNSFVVSGSFARETGLDTAARAARDAVYTVDKGDGNGAMEFRSSGNTVTIGSYKIEATLKDTGKATLEVGPDKEKIANALQKLTESYNKAINLLDSNSDRSLSVLKQQRNLLLPPTAEKSMKLVGITIGKNGVMSFDKTAFDKAMEENPKLARDVIGGAHSIASGLMQDAKTALNVSSDKLLGKDKLSTGMSGSVATQQAQYDKSQFSMLSAYSRSGAYNMLNYFTVGAMMNFNI